MTNIERARRRFLPMSETMFYILLSLRQRMHGYGVMLNVKKLTDGRITLGAGTIYQSIAKLESEGLITAAGEDDRKKLYEITGLGLSILREESARIAELYRNSEDLR